MTDKVKYWFELSKYHMKTAEAMMETKRFLYVGFMCHQTIEKILKAYYEKINNDTPPFTHKLITLAKNSNIYTDMDDEFLEFLDLLDILEPLNIEARYPTDKNEIFKSLNEKKSKEVLIKTNRLFEWISQKL
jgi:HEPN domain-containing protein